MSNKKATTAKTTEPVSEIPETQAAEVESLYSISELSASSQDLFKTTDIVVKTALTLGNKKEYTLSEAKSLVHEFTTKEVKK